MRPSIVFSHGEGWINDAQSEKSGHFNVDDEIRPLRGWEPKSAPVKARPFLGGDRDLLVHQYPVHHNHNSTRPLFSLPAVEER